MPWPRLDPAHASAWSAIGPLQQSTATTSAPSDQRRRERTPPSARRLAAYMPRLPLTRDATSPIRPTPRIPQARKQECQVALHHEAGGQHCQWQQLVLAARQRPALEDQQREGQDRCRRVPDVTEDFRFERAAHEGDRRRGHEHELATTAAMRQCHGTRHRCGVDHSHRHRESRYRQTGRHRKQPVEQRPRVVRGLAERGG